MDNQSVLTGRLLGERDAAQILACSVALLRKWRLYGGGPGFCRLGRLVRYSEADLATFIEQRRVEVA
jgi:hypothetical protein